MKKVLLLVCAAVCFLILAGKSDALMVTEIALTGGVDGMDGLQFDIYNDVRPGEGMHVNPGVYSFLIGASEPAGTAWAGGITGWNGETVKIESYEKTDLQGNHTTVYRVFEQGEESSSPLFELTGGEWADYSHGYLFWTFYQNVSEPYGYRQLQWKHSMTVYALTDSGPASPFAYTDFALDFNNHPSNGYTPTGYGHTRNPVPVPGAIWLLGSGLLGLVAVRRRKEG